MNICFQSNQFYIQNTISQNILKFDFFFIYNLKIKLHLMNKIGQANIYEI